MRPHFIFILASVTAALLVAAFYLKQHVSGTILPPASPEAGVIAPATNSNLEASVAQKPLITLVSNAPVATRPLTAEERRAAIDAELARLHELFMSGDPAALPLILADLNNPEKEIRDAAIEAAKQFGSTNAIPALKAAADDTEDLAEKIDLLKAAEFLTVPAMDLNGPHVDLTPEQIQAATDKYNRRHPQRPKSTNGVTGN